MLIPCNHGITKMVLHHCDCAVYLVSSIRLHLFLCISRHFIENLFAPPYLKETRLAQAQVDISQVLWVKNIGVEKSDKGQCSLLFFVEP